MLEIVNEAITRQHKRESIGSFLKHLKGDQALMWEVQEGLPDDGASNLRPDR